jgi:hypothetical protein
MCASQRFLVGTLGWAYWMWLAIKLGSFGMFLFGIPVWRADAINQNGFEPIRSCVRRPAS